MNYTIPNSNNKQDEPVFVIQNTTAQWSVGVTKPIHEICNIHTNMNFMEAFGYILIKNDLKTLFKTAFKCFDKL